MSKGHYDSNLYRVIATNVKRPITKWGLKTLLRERKRGLFGGKNCVDNKAITCLASKISYMLVSPPFGVLFAVKWSSFQEIASNVANQKNHFNPIVLHCELQQPLVCFCACMFVVVIECGLIAQSCILQNSQES